MMLFSLSENLKLICVDAMYKNLSVNLINKVRRSEYNKERSTVHLFERGPPRD